MKKYGLLLLIGLLSLPVIALSSGQVSADSLFQIAKFRDDKVCAISYTFDDGLLEHYTLVFPAFEKLGFKGTFWVNGNTINEGEKGPYNNMPRVSWKDLKTMSDQGQEISSHGWSHKNLVKCSPEELRVEIDRNDSIIEAKTGVRPITFCYAGNSKNDSVVKIASKNRVGTRTSQFSVGSKSTAENLDQRVQQLLTEGDWGVSMTHGITNGYDAFTSDTILWEHLRKVKVLEDKIWVGTFREVAAYVAERNNVKFQISKKGKNWVILPVCTLEKKLFKEPLTLVVREIGIRKLTVKQGGRHQAVVILPDRALVEFNPTGGRISVQMLLKK